jgi:hypothetical protein
MQFSMNKQHGLTRLKSLQLAFALAACTVTLVACGGGGGDPGATAPPPPPPAPVLVDPAVAMRGFWSGNVTTAPDGATRASAVVMPDGTGWVVLESNTAPVAVARIPFTGAALNDTDATVSGGGSYYRLSDGAKSAVSASGTASTKGTFKGNATVTGNAASAFDWVSTAGFTTAAQQADVVGTWNGTAGSGAVQVTWIISTAGAVTGSSSTGCGYAGTVKPSTGTAVYDVNVTEDCAGTVRAMNGIATLVANKTSLRVVFTAEAGASAGLFSLNKQ